MHAAEQLRGCQGRRRTSPATGRTRRTARSSAASPTAARYRFAGGAPLWISSCGYAPTCAGRYDLNNLADTAHIRAMPADGTVVRNVNDGGFYRFAGGAPLFVRCDMGAGCTAPTMIDGQTMAKLGTYTPATPRMRQFPPDGVVVVNGDDNQHYRFAGGAPLPIAAPAGAKQIIDSRTLVQQGTATAALPHMRPYPADSTFLTAGGGVLARGRRRRGPADQLRACSATAPGAVPVDPGTISGGGRRAPAGRARATARSCAACRRTCCGRSSAATAARRSSTSRASRSTTARSASSRCRRAPRRSCCRRAFKPVISSGYKVFRRYTRFTSLKVADAPAGSVDHRLLRRCKEGLPVQEGQAVPPEGQFAERLQPLVQEGQAQAAARPWWSASPARPVTASR